MSTAPSLLFVYGTLRPGYGANALLAEAKPEGTAETAANAFNLVAVDDPEESFPYPGMLQGGGGRVKGALYRVDEAMLAKLDEYEGPNYDRKVIKVKQDGRIFEAQAYMLKPDCGAVLDPEHPQIHCQEDPYCAVEWLPEPSEG